jgi:CheY-like chemotaxis protein
MAETKQALRILIVEDDPLNVKYMSVVLERIGKFEVLVSEDVEEIIRLAKEAGLCAIIMDISLSNSSHEGQKVDGTYITKLLKANPETASIPVVLATAHAMIGDREHFLAETNAEHYISKPFTDPALFLREVRRVIREPE